MSELKTSVYSEKLGGEIDINANISSVEFRFDDEMCSAEEWSHAYWNRDLGDYWNRSW